MLNMHGNALILSALLCLKIYLVPAQALAAGWIWDSVPAPIGFFLYLYFCPAAYAFERTPLRFGVYPELF